MRPRAAAVPSLRRALVLTVAVVALAGCSTKDIKDTLYVGGKLAYDTLKNLHENDRSSH